jgi:site-specific DNA recombinase
MSRTAIGIVRVSRVRGREGDSFISPSDQTDRITRWCEGQGIELAGVLEELDVSGGAAISDRPGLSEALKAIEAGEATVLVVAYFDRLVRSVRIQHDILERVETAGGKVFALDIGEISNATDGQWLQSGFLGLVAEYQRRQAKGRHAEAQARAIARGVATWNVQLPGYSKGENGVLIPNDQAPIIRQAFIMRADGVTVAGVRDYLREHGIERSYHGVTCLLRSRVYLGELTFGKLHNPAAHPAIIDPDLFNTVQRTKVSRGRKPKSDRLLARLGVLRCGTCDARMVIATGGHGNYWVYRCPPNGDCPRHMAISADIAEKVVVDAMWDALGDIEGRAAAEDRGRAARVALDKAQGDLNAAIEAFAGMETEPAAIKRLAELKAIRDTRLEEVDHLGHNLVPALTMRREDWPEMTPDGQRLLIKTVIDKAIVGPGKGASRITVLPFQR